MACLTLNRPSISALTIGACLLAMGTPCLPAIAATLPDAARPMSAGSNPDAEGIQFHCPEAQLRQLETGMRHYLHTLGIAPSLVATVHDERQKTLTYTLTTPLDDFNTLDFVARPALNLNEVRVSLPLKQNTTRAIPTVSQKEIVLALMQHGRLTVFAGSACHLAALTDHVGIRQNTVAWAEKLEFGWPDGGPARWNAKYWRNGTPRRGVPLHTAMADMFRNQSAYEVGCYTATKMVMIQGVLDYFSRVRPDRAKLKLIEARLLTDGEPLVDVEPGRVWNFESDFDAKELERPGKLLSAQFGVMPRNFVPGDWAYIVNPDRSSASKIGYEGSNAIYLGRNKFEDFYNDNEHAYSYLQKLDEVYQWRNQVFSRRHDGDKIQPLTAQQIDRLGQPPQDGGIVLDWRVAHQFFGASSPPQRLPGN
ncbi:hypothetical protein [Rugamonas apoptosis]|uniref:Uncharacterized protein n=1 Tax=Rugamonas apoptosis TaxID=2758570 RepID=A0A7W2FF45_9BURK|nr:hypothetical protein [Rugamonas apoptosis]MBA5690583.1 hypothetical protein [Rugamonas apoptosis]